MRALSVDTSENVDFSILDVTIRDGGYVNGHQWSVADSTEIVRAVDAANIPFVEIGYLREESDALRPSASCPPHYLRALAECATGVRLAVMVRPGEVPVGWLRRLAEHGVTMARILVRDGSVARAAPYLAEARDCGLTVTANLPRVSERTPEAVAREVAACAEAGAQLVYLADSNGGLFPEGVRSLVLAARSASPVPIGFHAHDNLGLAFINSRAAVAAGAVALDASIGGVGKGGGNLRLELIVAHQIAERRADLRLDPLLRAGPALTAQLMMLADSRSVPILSGLLDLNVDDVRAVQEEIASTGFDATVRRLAEARRPGHALARRS